MLCQINVRAKLWPVGSLFSFPFHQAIEFFLKYSIASSRIPAQRLNVASCRTNSLSFLKNNPGEMFGWSALVEPNEYTATAQCVKESKVIKVDGELLARVFERHSSEEGLMVMKRLAGVVASRLVSSYQEILA